MIGNFNRRPHIALLVLAMATLTASAGSAPPPHKRPLVLRGGLAKAPTTIYAIDGVIVCPAFHVAPDGGILALRMADTTAIPARIFVGPQGEPTEVSVYAQTIEGVNCGDPLVAKVLRNDSVHTSGTFAANRVLPIPRGGRSSLASRNRAIEAAFGAALKSMGKTYVYPKAPEIPPRRLSAFDSLAVAIQDSADLNGDGYADYIVHVRGRTHSGVFYEVSGETDEFENTVIVGSQGNGGLSTVMFDGCADWTISSTGWRLHGYADLDGDGKSELIMTEFFGERGFSIHLFVLEKGHYKDVAQSEDIGGC